MEKFDDIKIGDSVYFAKGFCDLVELKVKDIKRPYINTRIFEIQLDGIEYKDGWVEVVKTENVSHTATALDKYALSAGRICLSKEAYKEFMNNKLQKFINDMYSKRKELNDSIAACEDDIKTLNNF